MRNYLFLKLSKKISFYSSKLIVVPHPLFFFPFTLLNRQIAEDSEDFYSCLKYCSTYHKNADGFKKVISAMGYCYCKASLYNVLVMILSS